MAFPEDILPLQVDLSLDGSTWTDVSDDVRYEDKIRITRGRSDWGRQTDPGRCSLAFSNTDGKYSPSNPEGPYFGQIGRNTPLRVSVNTGAVALDLPGNPGDSASTPDTAALDVTDLDVRIDATLVNWSQAEYPSAGGASYPRTELIGKRTAGQISWALYMSQGRPYFEWSTNGTTENWVWASVDPPVPPSGRLALRFTMDVNNGAGGCDVAFYTAPTMAGPWTLLDSGTLGTTSIYAGTAPLTIGDASEETTWQPAIGRVHKAEVRNGINGTIVANPDFTAQTSGVTSFVDGAGLTWTVAGGAEITNRKVRFVGEIASWTPRWDTGGDDVVTSVEAAGVLRRLGVGSVPTKSPFYREFTSAGRMAAGIVAYWPMEDGADAATIASAYTSHPPMTMTAGVTLAAYDDWVASDPIPTISSGSMRVTVPAYALNSIATGQVGFFCHVPAGGVLSTQRLVSVAQTGTAWVWSVWLNTSGNVAVRAYDADGLQIHDSGFSTDSINDRQKYIILQTWQNGADINFSLIVVDILDSLPTTIPDNASETFTVTGTVTGRTAGRISQVRFGEDAGMAGTAIGHLLIGATSSATTATAGVMVAWNAEEGPSRVARIGYEERLHAYPTGAGDERCGVQPRGTALDIMHSAAEVDEGIFGELRSVLGLRYVTRASLYNQTPVMVMDYTGSDGLVTPLDPAADDQGVTNDVSVARTSGSSARVTLPTGALSTQPPPDGIGLYDTSTTLNLLNDDQPLQHAGWRLHLGTWDEIRFPQVTIDLANAPHMIDAAAEVDTGSRIQITNPPVWLPPDTIDLLVQGYSETIDQFTWKITYNCSPARPFDVAWTGAANTLGKQQELQWADTTSTRLAEALTTTETDVDVFTTSGPRWTPNVADLPFVWRIGGETMTVNAPGTLLNTNPYFTADTSGWTGQNATLTRTTTVVAPHPTAVASMLLTPTGGISSADARTSLSATGTVLPGVPYTASAWVYSPNGWSDLRCVIDFYDAAGAFISTGASTATSVAASTWTLLTTTSTAPAGASRYVIRVRSGNTPTATDVVYMWAARLTRTTSSWLADAFGRTVASSWGTAETGQAWQTGGGTAADYNVTGGYGAHRLSVVNSSRRSFVDCPHANFDFYVSLTTSATATGGPLHGGPTGRYIDSLNLYHARLSITTANTLSLAIIRMVGGVETNLGSAAIERTYSAGTWIRIRFQASGSTLRAKAWAAAAREPDTWHVTATDSAITTSSYIGVRSISASTNTNVNPEIRYDDVDIVNPQTYTVTRSTNGVTKTHAAGAPLSVATPAVIAL